MTDHPDRAVVAIAIAGAMAPDGTVFLNPPLPHDGPCTCTTYGVSDAGRCRTCGGWRPGEAPDRDCGGVTIGCKGCGGVEAHKPGCPANPRQAPTSAALADVIAEREKQRAKWGDAHDDGHDPGDLAKGAAHLVTGEWVFDSWPKLLRRKNPAVRARLVIAAALLLAEIERIDRATKEG